MITTEKEKDLYNVWLTINKMCYDKTHKFYYVYGSQGVSVCGKWQNYFESFKSDMGFRPDGCTLERVDSNKGYSKNNCKWAKLL